MTLRARYSATGSRSHVGGCSHATFPCHTGKGPAGKGGLEKKVRGSVAEGGAGARDVEGERKGRGKLREPMDTDDPGFDPYAMPGAHPRPHGWVDVKAWFSDLALGVIGVVLG